MNERIRELAKQAGFSAKHTDVYFDRQLERFAKLIREDERLACLEIADYCAEAHMPSSMAANAIHARRNKE